MSINNVLIYGLGALGTTYASKLNDICELKILVSKNRLNKLNEKPPIFNNKILELDYILPNSFWNADLIIISTKASGLEEALKDIKNFVNEKTIIISLINGISSEEKIASIYGWGKVIRSYFIGHSAIKNGNFVTQDGIGKIVLEPCVRIENFFRENKIDYEIFENINYSQWVKLGVNIILNELSAIYNLTVGEVKKRTDFASISEKLIDEILEVAKAEKINSLENYRNDVLNSINLIADDGKTSMLQDILAKRKTEIDIFSGEIINRAKKHNILTPENIRLYNKIKEIEKDY